MNALGEPGTDTQALESTLRELLAPERLPDYIKFARYELGTDHTGEPAVRVFLGIEPKMLAILEKDKEQRGKYIEFSDDLSFKILRLESGYFPYIRMAEAA
jgi:hypothetical protein